VPVASNGVCTCDYRYRDYHKEASYLMALLTILSAINQAINEELMAFRVSEAF